MKVYLRLLSISDKVKAILSCNASGPGYSKRTTSLVNLSLNFQKLISQICQYICWKNVGCFSHFLTKNFSVFGYEVIKHLKTQF